LLGAGVAVKETARRLGISARTLRRQLGRGRKPSTSADTKAAEILAPIDAIDRGGES
jgi:transposase-like protein